MAGHMPGDMRRAIESARKLIASWPAWKRGILEASGRQFVSVPRKPVDNFRTTPPEPRP